MSSIVLWLSWRRIENWTVGGAVIWILIQESGSIPALVYGTSCLQRGEQVLGTGGHGLGLMEYDGLGAHLFAVKVLVGSVVGPESGTRKGDPGENSTRSRVGKNLGTHSDISFG